MAALAGRVVLDAPPEQAVLIEPLGLELSRRLVEVEVETVGDGNSGPLKVVAYVADELSTSFIER